MLFARTRCRRHRLTVSELSDQRKEACHGVAISEVNDLAVAVLRSLGYSQEEADTIAEHLIDCELRGISAGQILGGASRARIREAIVKKGRAGTWA